MQGSHYTAGLQAWEEQVEHYVIAAIETEPPFEITLFQIATSDMMIANETWRAHLELLAHCVETEEWPGYAEQTQVLHMGPYWQTDMRTRVAEIAETLRDAKPQRREATK